MEEKAKSKKLTISIDIAEELLLNMKPGVPYEIGRMFAAAAEIDVAAMAKELREKDKAGG